MVMREEGVGGHKCTRKETKKHSLLLQTQCSAPSEDRAQCSINRERVGGVGARKRGGDEQTKQNVCPFLTPKEENTHNHRGPKREAAHAHIGIGAALAGDGIASCVPQGPVEATGS